MKNIPILAIFALIAFTACKKDRTCTCTTTYTYTGTYSQTGFNATASGNQTQTDKYEVKKATKKQALASDCASVNGTIDNVGSSTQTYTVGSPSSYNSTQKAIVNRDCSLD